MVLMARQQTAPWTKSQLDDKAFVYSDDECVQKLAALVEHKNNRNLAEIARLISRLAVPIE